MKIMKNIIGLFILWLGLAGVAPAAFSPPGPPPGAGTNVGYMGDVVAGLPYGLGNVGTHRVFDTDGNPMTHSGNRLDPNNTTVTHWYSFTLTSNQDLGYFLELGDNVKTFSFSFFDSSGSEHPLGSVNIGSTPPHDYQPLAHFTAGDPWWMKVVGLAEGELDSYTVKLTASPIPLPPALLLFGSAIAGFGLMGRKKKQLAS